MPRKKETELSPQEAQDQIVLSSFERKLIAAKKSQAQTVNRMKAVFDDLEAMCIDPSEVPTAAENANNLEEAISCYVLYGEYTRSGIMREVRAAYGKEPG